MGSNPTLSARKKKGRFARPIFFLIKRIPTHIREIDRFRNSLPPFKTIRVKTTRYFDSCMTRPDRVIIQKAWIQRVIDDPEKEEIQKDGRIRRWSRIPEMGNKYLRVVLLPDHKTVHNAFFDRRFGK